MGLPAEASSYPKGQVNSRVAVEEPSSLHQLQQLACRECRPQNPRLKLWAVLEDTVCRKHHYSLDSLRRSLVKAAAEISLETGACSDSRVAGESQGSC